MNKTIQKWGNDELTKFFDRTRDLGLSTFDDINYQQWMYLLVEIDKIFLLAMPLFAGKRIEGLMFLCAHSVFLAATEFSIQGRTAESMP